MKLKITFTTIIIALLQLSVSAEEPLTAAQWADKEKTQLEGINEQSLIAIAKAAPDSYRKLFAEVKADYKSNPIELTRIAALTQIITSKAKITTRNTYADELLNAAKKAEAADVACFFIDQLRWCATGQQTKGIQELTKSDKKGVAAIAAIAVLASENNFDSQQKNIKSNIYSEYSTQLAKLKGTKKTKALMDGFENADIKIAGIAMREAAQIDLQYEIAGMGERQASSINKKRHAAGKQETKLWCQKLSTTSDTTRKIMLLDMLGMRGDPEAVVTLGEYIGYADTGIAQAAQLAMIKIDPKAFIDKLPPVLKNLSGTHVEIMKKSLLSVSGELVEEGLIKDFDSYSMAGKSATMETLQARRSQKGVQIALVAINSSAAEEVKNGLRLLRDCAGPDEADVLIKKLLKTRHGSVSDIQSAIAGPAKRDTKGSYIELLENAWKNKKNQDQTIALIGTFGRIGDKKLLPLTEDALKDSDAEVAVAAVKALVAWDNNDSVNSLINIAYTSDNSKYRVLAQRGIEKKLGVKGVDKGPYKTEWQKISAGTGDAEMKKKLDVFFAK